MLHKSSCRQGAALSRRLDRVEFSGDLDTAVLERFTPLDDGSGADCSGADVWY